MNSYQFGPKIGGGGMADVYQAVHTELQRPVAIKVMKDMLSGDPNFVDRFYREGRVSARMQHPHIVHVYDMGQYEGRPMLVMELLEGETLRHRLRHGALPEAEAVSIARQVLEALAYAHDQHEVVHRDIKPANVFLSKDGRARLMDFGIASAAAEARLTGTAALFGTPDYMSPEQTEGRTDSRTDLYAVGIMLYEMLTGDTPFRADNMLAVMNMHRSSQPPPLPNHISPRVRAAVAKALEKDASTRFQSAREMLAALDPTLLPPSDTNSGLRTLQPLNPVPKSRGALIGVSGGVCVVALCGIGYTLLNPTGGKTTLTPTPIPTASPLKKTVVNNLGSKPVGKKEIPPKISIEKTVKTTAAGIVKAEVKLPVVAPVRKPTPSPTAPPRQIVKVDTPRRPPHKKEPAADKVPTSIVEKPTPPKTPPKKQPEPPKPPKVKTVPSTPSEADIEKKMNQDLDDN